MRVSLVELFFFPRIGTFSLFEYKSYNICIYIRTSKYVPTASSDIIYIFLIR